MHPVLREEVTTLSPKGVRPVEAECLPQEAPRSPAHGEV